MKETTRKHTVTEEPTPKHKAEKTADETSERIGNPVNREDAESDATVKK